MIQGMAKPKTWQEILCGLEAQWDGQPTREVGGWSLVKLGIVSLYLPAFTRACKKASPGAYYVDAFAGPGMCKVRRTIAPPDFVWGSPLLALRTSPEFHRCILVELDSEAALALSQRIEPFGERGRVVAGDANEKLPAIVRDEIPAGAPCFCLLDPEGMELQWQTVQAVAGTPGRRRKPELLILFPSTWLPRLLPTKEGRDPHDKTLDRLMPSGDWRQVYEDRKRGKISPDFAIERYAELYEAGLKELGYGHVFGRKVLNLPKPGGTAKEIYKLFFATDHPKGNEIMDHVFKRNYQLDFPVTARQPLFD